MIIGLTGGIGSGKTTVLNYFKTLGATVFIADIEAKKLMHTSVKVKEAVTKLFGEEAYVDGKLNRAFIAGIVFKDKAMLQKLNGIVHPALKTSFLSFAETITEGYIIYESAILFENDNSDFCDKIILVTAPVETRINRVLKRDNITREQVQNRIDNQLSDAIKKEKYDFVIENIELSKTKNRVLQLHELFSKSC